MRYLVQLLIPALIFVGVVYLLTRRRRDASLEGEEKPASDTGAFIAILAVSALVALGTAYAMTQLWGSSP
jgi:hypothetical protein